MPFVHANKPPLTSYDQACISTKVGGLGIRRVVDHSVGAFNASWHESRRTCGESWDAPELCDEKKYVPQSEFSADVDRKALDALIDGANERDAQRLRRVDMPHANVWSSALPSSQDDKDCVLPPRVYLTCVRRRSSCVSLSCPLSSLQANHGCFWRSRLMLQEVRGHDHKAQQSEKPCVTFC